VPRGCEVLMACRSGSKDVNDKSFQNGWSRKVTGLYGSCPVTGSPV
jgi:hypothetical protein